MITNNEHMLNLQSLLEDLYDEFMYDDTLDKTWRAETMLRIGDVLDFPDDYIEFTILNGRIPD